jgi:hypothetical protein
LFISLMILYDFVKKTKTPPAFFAGGIRVSGALCRGVDDEGRRHVLVPHLDVEAVFDELLGKVDGDLYIEGPVAVVQGSCPLIVMTA